MPDCFISYSSQDENFAVFVKSELEHRGLTVFMASASLVPGDRWAPEIFSNLNNSNWVILLASRAACESAFVNQEFGVALGGSKNVVPIIWDIEPTELPGWANQFQALNLKGSDGPALKQQVGSIAEDIKQKKTQGEWIALAAFAGLLFLFDSE